MNRWSGGFVFRALVKSFCNERFFAYALWSNRGFVEMVGSLMTMIRGFIHVCCEFFVGDSSRCAGHRLGAPVEKVLQTHLVDSIWQVVGVINKYKQEAKGERSQVPAQRSSRRVLKVDYCIFVANRGRREPTQRDAGSLW